MPLPKLIFSDFRRDFLMQKRHLVLSCLLLVLAFALSACGGSSGGGSDEGQIEAAIETAATSNDPSGCTEFSTQQFLEQSTGTEGAGAKKKCEEEATDEEQAESAEVSEVEVNGSEATAETKFTGGPLDGQAVEIALVKEGSNWKLNELVGFTKLDKSTLASTLGTKLKEQGGVSAELAPCIEAGIEEVEQSELEELVFAGSTAQIEEIAEECQG
jgi:predicted small secreted protein